MMETRVYKFLDWSRPRFHYVKFLAYYSPSDHAIIVRTVYMDQNRRPIMSVNDYYPYDIYQSDAAVRRHLKNTKDIIMNGGSHGVAAN